MGLAVMLLAVTACSSQAAPPSVAEPPEPNEPSEADIYVALGDSYTAAPGIAVYGSADGCLRSARNYPALVARELPGTALVDVSCAGASTVQMDVAHPFEASSHPPQLDALSADTDLVTVGIGANDYGLFSSVIHQCVALAATDPTGSPCRDAHLSPDGWDALDLRVELISDRLADTVDKIADRAPDARILVVGYPQLLPVAGRCPKRMPLAQGDYSYAGEVFVALSEALRDGAESAGAEYVDVLSASFGHDVCSTKPWMNGIVERPERAMPYHPYPAGQRAVADLILDML